MSEAAVRAIVEANPFMILATADAEGRPWASPVWYATVDCREFFWVSKPEARHSRNLSGRPELAIVVFDSRQTPGDVEALYLSATAEHVPEAELDRGLEAFSRVSQAQGLPAWSRENVLPPARHRLYRAIAVEYFLLTSTDERLPVALP
jgi:nitroimidazol reductase NimA-like FMN-containing flavoprotein (pyridoxamine 5'-phosphate oxidase superfamily)